MLIQSIKHNLQSFSYNSMVRLFIQSSRMSDARAWDEVDIKIYMFSSNVYIRCLNQGNSQEFYIVKYVYTHVSTSSVTHAPSGCQISWIIPIVTNISCEGKILLLMIFDFNYKRLILTISVHFCFYFPTNRNSHTPSMIFFSVFFCSPRSLFPQVSSSSLRKLSSIYSHVGEIIEHFY